MMDALRRKRPFGCIRLPEISPTFFIDAEGVDPVVRDRIDFHSPDRTGHWEEKVNRADNPTRHQFSLFTCCKYLDDALKKLQELPGSRVNDPVLAKANTPRQVELVQVEA
jgi:hypothetical protein